jgi:antitoxin (DNA-binding transcriptional repressor) of toxin-antitoxin stability system
MSYMRKISTRELAHRTRAVREAIEAGESLAWMAHGRVVAYLRPSGGPTRREDAPDWISRARAADAVNRSATEASSLIYSDRG